MNYFRTNEGLKKTKRGASARSAYSSNPAVSVCRSVPLIIYDDDDDNYDGHNKWDHSKDDHHEREREREWASKAKGGTRVSRRIVPGVPEGLGVAPLREVPDHRQADADLEHEEVALERLTGYCYCTKGKSAECRKTGNVPASRNKFERNDRERERTRGAGGTSTNRNRQV